MHTQSVPSKPAQYETKYVFDVGATATVLGLLRRICAPDPQFPRGTVSSIYYDTRSWRFLGEKVNSDYSKTKVRLRWYSDMNGHSEYSFAEAKLKTGTHRRKIRVKTDLGGDRLLRMGFSDPRLRRVPELLRAHGLVVGDPLFPAFVITYRRERFVEPITGARICLDYDIRAPRANPLVVPKWRPVRLANGVFEMKGSVQELPASLRRLAGLGCRRFSFSKYGRCYEEMVRAV